MTSIYILTSAFYPGECKIGKYTGSLNELISRYITQLRDVKVHYFITTTHAAEVERQILNCDREFRIKNVRGNYSNWMTLSVDNVFGKISAIIMRCDNAAKEE